MENTVTHSISNELFNTFLLVTAAVAICVLCYFSVPLDTLAILKFLITYLGYASFALVPMTILIFSIFIHALIIPLPEDCIWAKIANRFQKDFQYVGLLGTFLAIGLSLNSLDATHMTTDSIFQIAKEIGSAIWSSIVGVGGSMIANFIVEELTIATPEEEPAFTPQPAIVYGFTTTPEDNDSIFAFSSFGNVNRSVPVTTMTQAAQERLAAYA
jgi:hypothetical protein